MRERNFRPPTDRERAFLAIATHGNADLRTQIATCKVADYDRTGWFDIATTAGTPTTRTTPVEGPFVSLDARTADLARFVETSESGIANVGLLLSINGDGFLESIEVVAYGDCDVIDPFGFFIAASQADPPLLIYAPPP